MKAQLATICYLDNGSQLLLLKRNKKANDIHEGKWVSVGGKFEAGESPEECAKREIYEETHLTAKKLNLLGTITFPDFTHDGRDWYCFVYRVPEFEGDLVKDSDEGRLEWIDYDQVMSMPTWKGDYIYLDWILNKAPYFSAKFTYNEAGDLDSHTVEFYDTDNHKKQN